MHCIGDASDSPHHPHWGYGFFARVVAWVTLTLHTSNTAHSLRFINNDINTVVVPRIRVVVSPIVTSIVITCWLRWECWPRVSAVGCLCGLLPFHHRFCAQLVVVEERMAIWYRSKRRLTKQVQLAQTYTHARARPILARSAPSLLPSP